ncbi:MAG: hypothetical protein HYY84_05455 [Deltaproteobacteria bacterium]|nr:hypothetical protein [Deltaproteobacteria bacterium]
MLLESKLSRSAETPSPVEDSWTAAALLVAAAILFGVAVQIRNGRYSVPAFFLIAIAGVLALFAVANPRLKIVEGRGDSILLGLLFIGLLAQFAQLAGQAPGIYLKPGPLGLRVFQHGIGAVAVLAGVAVVAPLRTVRACFFAALAIHFVLGVWTISVSPDPAIDVFTVHTEAFKALFAGESPFSITIPNIYGDDTPFYVKSTLAGGRVQVGYPYPPLGLLLALPGHLVGDFRYATLVAMHGAALFMAFARPGRIGALVALLYLFTPRAFFVLEQAWTEPFVVLGFSATCFLACRGSRRVPIVLGFLFAAKQYVFLAGATAFFLDGKFAWRRTAKTLGIAAAIAFATVLPFVVWDFDGFLWSVIEARKTTPFRPDSLTFLAWLDNHDIVVGGWVGLVGMAVPLGLAYWRGVRSPSGFATSVAALYFVAFSFSVAAHCNYYYLVIGLLCIAVAVMRPAGALEEPVVLHRSPVSVKLETSTRAGDDS